jgi:Ni/Fe-hydrogenase subunit HybB-like protein
MTPDRSSPKFLTPGAKVLLVLTLAGVLALIYRFAFGLRAATNLDDGHPWGLWIAADDLVGAALAAGGFSITGAYHVFGWKKYQPMVRPAVLTAFLGYALIGVAIAADLGKPWAIWHPFVYGRPHSIMFAVSICVAAYLGVLAFEFAPVAAEGLGRARLRGVLLKWSGPLAVLGIVLAFLHQSSLGALFLLMQGRLSPLWYSPLLPIHFFLSSLAVGLAMVSFESILSARVFKREYELEPLRGLARGAQIALAVALVVRLIDLTARGHLGLAFAGNSASALFLLEVLPGMVLPLALYSLKAVRDSVNGLLIASSLVVFGVLVNRFNVTFFAQAGARTAYFPSIAEIAITVGLISFLMLAYRFLVLHLPVLADEPHPVGRA